MHSLKSEREHKETTKRSEQGEHEERESMKRRAMRRSA
tara:strand:+ start:742 stop:855 length:114 start_codon:yes stop_codon:yes gene_type:complete